MIVAVSALMYSAEAVEHTYVPNTESYGDDASVSFASDGKISELAIGTSASKVVFSGDAVMEFADDGFVKMPLADGHELIISNKVEAEGGFLVKAGERPVVSWVGEKLPSVTSENRTTVASGADISKLEIVSSQFSQSSISGTGYAYFTRRGEGWMESQMQVISSGSSLIKCVKIRLEQRGDDIVASKVYARYTLKTDGKARDFDTITEKIASGTPAENQYRENSYELKQLTLRHVDPRPRVILAAPKAPEGIFTVATTPENPPVNEWRLFAVNQTLATMKPRSAKLAGASLSTNPVDAHLRGWSNEGLTASVWVQYMADGNPPGTLKGVRASFRQNGSDVEIKVDSARHLKQPSAEPYYTVDTDLSTTYSGGGGIAPSPDADGYCLAAFAADFSSQSASNVVVLSPGMSDFAGGEVGATGNLALSVTNSNFGSGKVSLSVSDGARLQVLKYDAFSQMPEIKCNAASLDVCIMSAYIRRFSIDNGSYVRGMPFRAGNTSSTTLYSGGNGALSVIEPSIVLVGMSSGNADVVFDIADGDRTSSADVALLGGLRDFDSQTTRGPVTIVKKGDGTISFAGPMTYGLVSQCSTIISNGIWELSANAITCEHQNYVLAGGGITVAASTTNTLGSLRLEGAGTISFGDASRLEFADSSQFEWSDDSVLNVSCGSRRRMLRFGTDANGLSGRQLEMIRIDGKNVVIDENGWVKVPAGFNLIVR